MGPEEALTLKPIKCNANGFLRWQEQLEAWLIILDLITTIEKRLPYDVSSSSSRLRSSSRSFDSSDTSKIDKSPEEIEFHYWFRIL